MESAKSSAAVCTLFEGDYHYGVGALVNSLHEVGFRGRVWAGYKGSLPPWAKVDSLGVMVVTDDLEICFKHLETDWHLANYKAAFMRELFEKQGGNWSALFYFDPDIVVTCRWSFYEEWAGGGIALVQDLVNTNMPSNHPIRNAWLKFMGRNGITKTRDLNQYFNSGFVGVSRNNKSFIDLWELTLKRVFAEGDVSPVPFMPGDRTRPFHGIDQDCLNISAMATNRPLSTIGAEGMGFIHGGFTMLHALAHPKPWRFSCLDSVLKAQPPSMPIKKYWDHVQSPIRLYSTFDCRFKHLMVKSASVFGRFYSRG